MKVLIAPDKFAGTLTAAEAGAAIREGWLRARPLDELQVVPLADGGEGPLDVVGSVVADARVRELEVADARGRATVARWLQLPNGWALVECAQACGLSQLAPEDRDPLRATTYGVGQLIAAALAAEPAALVVGLGGSATVDGGAGMAIALGHRLLRADGNGIKVGGRWIADLDRVEPADGPRVPVIAASDVTAPLLGPEGAAQRFGPQKGADPDAVAELEAALTRYADVVERDVPGGPWRDQQGAGAAGGLGFGLMAFLGAGVRSGAEIVADLVGFDPADADVLVTGEGALDAQTGTGKVPSFVLRRGRQVGARVLAVAGRVEGAAAEAFDDVEELGPEGLERPAELLGERAAALAARLA